MNEIRDIVVPVRLDMLCECKEGRMRPTGTAFLTSPVKHEHLCNNCGRKANYPVVYPHVQYEVAVSLQENAVTDKSYSMYVDTSRIRMGEDDPVFVNADGKLQRVAGTDAKARSQPPVCKKCGEVFTPKNEPPFLNCWWHDCQGDDRKAQP